jgi:hypothetical protein
MNKLLIKYRLFLVWIVGCLILISRRPSLLFSPQFWCEDGFVFFHEALKYGWQSVLMPYAGYIHLVPRTITNLVLQLSEALEQEVAWAPMIMSLSAVALNSICAVAVCASKFNWMGNWYFRMILSLFILLFPNAYELFGSVTNVNWWLGVLAFFLLWNMFQTRKMPNWFETIILSIIVLTSPNGLLILPAIVGCYFYVYKTKPTYELFKVFFIFLLTCVQVVLMLDSRVPKDADWTLFLTNAINFVFVKLFGHLLIGLILNEVGTLIVGIVLFIVLLFLCRNVLKKIYFPVVFLFLLVFLTVFGVDSGQLAYYDRYIFIPSVVVVCILIYSFRERLQKKGDKFRIGEIALFCLIFSLIAVRTVRNYKIPSFLGYPWKTLTVEFDRQGDVFYSFPACPDHWSVGFPSSFNRDSYIPQSQNKFTIDNSHIVSIKDIVLNDSLYTVTGSYPSVCYQLPEKPLSYCWIDFDRSIDALQMVFISETDAEFAMMFHVEENNLMNLNECIQTTKMKFVYFNFYDPLCNGSFALPDSSFVIKQFHFYTLP